MSYENPTIDEAIEAMLPDTPWNVWPNYTITYAFATSETQMKGDHPPYKLPFVGVATDDELRKAIQDVAKLWSSYIPRELAEAPQGVTADITVARYYDDGHIGGGANPPPVGDLYISTGAQRFSPGGAGFETVFHEFGHALGLDHAGFYNNDMLRSEMNPLTYQDSKVYSVMSYFGPGTTAPANGSEVQTAVWSKGGIEYYAQTAMMNDIAAIQKIYGVNHATRAEDNTIYGFNSASSLSESDQKIYSFETNENPILCIYDAGGLNDTLNLSGWTTSSAISLIPGTFSNANSMTMNISIERETTIEHAIGGSGNDVILGNSVANILVGNAGNDGLLGAGGDDTLIGGRGEDVIVGGFPTIPYGWTTTTALTDELRGMWNAYATADVVGEIDTADYSAQFQANLGMTSGIRVNMTLAEFQVTNDGFGSRDTLVSIEKIIGTEFADEFNVAGSLKIIDGGDENDRVSFSSSNVAVQIDLNQTTQHGGIAEGVQLTSIEEVVTGGGFDTIRLKNTGVTKAWGGNGNDTFIGGQGETTAYGDGNEDTFVHLGGKSIFHGGAGDYDTLDLSSAGDGGFDVNFSTSRGYNKGDDTNVVLEFYTVEKFIGSAGQDKFLFGNEINAATTAQLNFNGGAGTAIDTLDFSQNTQGVTLIYGSATTLKTTDGRKFFVGFEQFVGSDKDDTLALNIGVKEAHGGNGINTLDIKRWTGDLVTYHMDTQTYTTVGANIIVDGFSRFISNPGQIGIVGTESGETLAVSSGADRIWGRGGADIFQYSTGVDRLWGEAGNDTFTGKSGDYIDGGADYDILTLKAGGYNWESMDRYVGIEEFHFEGASTVTYVFKQTSPTLSVYSGSGVDRIFFDTGTGSKHVETGGGNDVVYAWGAGHYDGGSDNNTLDLHYMPGVTLDKTAQDIMWQGQTLHYENFATIKFNNTAGVTIHGLEAGETLIGSFSTTEWHQDFLNGRGGIDRLISTGGGDVLTGGTEADTFVFRSSSDGARVTDFERGVDSIVCQFDPGRKSLYWEEHGNDMWLRGDGTIVAVFDNVGPGAIPFVYDFA